VACGQSRRGRRTYPRARQAGTGAFVRSTLCVGGSRRERLAGALDAHHLAVERAAGPEAGDDVLAVDEPRLTTAQLGEHGWPVVEEVRGQQLIGQFGDDGGGGMLGADREVS
jgi:hypothetical protein